MLNAAGIVRTAGFIFKTPNQLVTHSPLAYKDPKTGKTRLRIDK
jgi:hypothetical protein